jgi:nucleoside 2-deoxyribosyltransferase
MKIYFAAPLFTQGEWQWNKNLAREIEKLDSGLEVILPQNDAEPMLKGKVEFDPCALFKNNVEKIDSADVVLAIFDQADPDSGTSWECGYAYKKLPVIGLRTDIRGGGDSSSNVNLMLLFGCKEYINIPMDKIDDLSFIAKEIIEKIKGIL